MPWIDCLNTEFNIDLSVNRQKLNCSVTLRIPYLSKKTLGVHIMGNNSKIVFCFPKSILMPIVSCWMEFLNQQLIRLSPSSRRRLNAAPLIYAFPGYLYFLATRICIYVKLYFYSVWIQYITSLYIFGTFQVSQLFHSLVVIDSYLRRSSLCLHYMPCFSTPVG